MNLLALGLACNKHSANVSQTKYFINEKGYEQRLDGNLIVDMKFVERVSFHGTKYNGT